MNLEFKENDYVVKVTLNQDFIEEAKAIKNLEAEYILITKDFNGSNLLYGKVIYTSQGFHFTGLDPKGNIIATPTINYKDLK